MANQPDIWITLRRPIGLPSWPTRYLNALLVNQPGTVYKLPNCSTSEVCKLHSWQTCRVSNCPFDQPARYLDQPGDKPPKYFTHPTSKTNTVHFPVDQPARYLNWSTSLVSTLPSWLAGQVSKLPIANQPNVNSTLPSWSTSQVSMLSTEGTTVERRKQRKLNTECF